MNMVNDKKEPKFVEKETKKVDVWRYKKYVCKVKILDIYTGAKIIVLNEDEAKEHDMYWGYRTQVCTPKKECVVAIVDVSDELVKPGEIGIFKDVAKDLNLKDGDKTEIMHMDRPASISYIKRKLDGETLKPDEVQLIVKEIMEGKLSEIETSAWISAAYIRGFSDEEIIALTHATVNSGDKLELGKKGICDKHCVGGVVGNRTTMLIVPMIACTDLYIPKTSSRSITSPSGTADTFEVLTDVEIEIEEMRKIVLKAHGAIVWGGGMNLAPVDDRLIKIRHPLSLDPEGMLLASILGKKKCVGAENVIIDIPVGRGAKIPYMEKAQQLGDHFIKIGKSIGMNIEVLITDGAEPVGNGVGPALECRDVLQVLEGKGPNDLRHKSIFMTGKLLELAGKCNVGKGYDVASDLIRNGKANKKFREIVGLQGGNPNVKISDLPIGQYTYDVKTEREGQIYHIDNKMISKIARIAGAPRDDGAGVYVHRIRGDRVVKGDLLFTIYAESETKLSFAIKALEDLEPIEFRKMLLGSMS
uniref:AMP phosphorylase n=2 Tax=uncultured Candidatus Micrarchaeota archaeon TaxID=2220064 RepID=A0A447ITZ8_9ARCH|nr:AMP phosphorylase [uncultured Candidatus Micrarchaeota archaeon]VDS10995.1 AMP phosphorylase [uncultured Candidatus Micrarchaeota archaeon]VDS11004.1 AMP phosphorylase [uncultured Candidatus Micrarchaeota archaeon]